MSETNWQSRRDAVVAADGDEWDRLSEAYDADWVAAYCAAFRTHARARGWTETNIESGWLDDLPRHALIERGWDGTNPADVAAHDVDVCEREVADE